jgi:hypothetical protein
MTPLAAGRQHAAMAIISSSVALRCVALPFLCWLLACYSPLRTFTDTIIMSQMYEDYEKVRFYAATID